MIRLRTSFVPSLLVVAFAPAGVHGSFVEYTDYAAWQTAAGPYTTIGFDEVPHFTFVSDEYAELGVVFPSPFDFTIFLNPDSQTFPIDGAGLEANWHPVELVFDAPRNWIGMHHPGDLQILLYDGDTLLYDTWIMGGGGVNFFSGVVSSVSFDRVVVQDPFQGSFAMDNLYFGGLPVPAPAVSSALVLAGLFAGLRRRRA